MFGVSLKESITDEMYDKIEKANIDILTDEDDGIKTPAIGIMYNFDEEIPIDYMEYSELQLIFEKIKQIFPDVKLTDFKIYYGTRYC